MGCHADPDARGFFVVDAIGRVVAPAQGSLEGLTVLDRLGLRGESVGLGDHRSVLAGIQREVAFGQG